MKLIRQLWHYKELIGTLVKKEMKSRYKGSVLGFFWMLLSPSLQLIVYAFVFTYIIRMDVDRYYLFLFVALVPWIFFSTCLSAGANVVTGQQDLIKKVSFPREVLPVAFTISQLINLMFSFL